MQAHDDNNQLSPANTRNGLIGVAIVLVVLLCCFL